MNFRKPDNTADLIDSIINSENGKVQKYLLERKRKEKEFLEKKENIKKQTLKAPKLNQMFVKNKSNDDKLISETVGLRTVHEYKKIKDKIFSKEKDITYNESSKDTKNKKHTNFKLSFCSDDDEDDEDEEGEKKTQDPKNKSDENSSEKEQNEREKMENSSNESNSSETEQIDKNLQKEKSDNTENGIKPKNEGNEFKKIMKDPTVNTSFLKDKDRDRKIELKKKELRELYFKLENEQKEKDIEITYSYYDGSGHRRKISVKQKNTIGQFINKCVDNLKHEFTNLRSASCETLMFVKEDLILPNYLTFYELIKNKAQGKTGPLFSFDAVEDLSGITDIRKNKTDTHAGKLVERKWYERNKHIFPASKWEIYKPSTNYGTNYKDLFNNFS
ncbi:XAP-5 DNA binding protein, putative [Plasmodium chabaudi chabaudi]|uniref:XAP-5 DNA binding protein, putative n=1 Tax=Plasmodium chabaudi chabaudi TaxID=31271 RepID=A0A077TS75_PLACU|nr:XAP-5 DNA binding protein, putative [Plasmodium chabaudi chabaudi]SCM25593.1 XAP-5 DNA binding protein, putative [Plasmodium chabaudi chabaudi]VTZ69925.1 XAP-5 DNA binding protein, putative [Plasmodium chabaudi chabaudi]|eukprot:XP_739909.2 XAP-5 DNA binding protein, putative [Plasmodium chabaudi chabaudi]